MPDDIQPVTELKKGPEDSTKKPSSGLLQKIRESKFKFLLIVAIACAVFAPLAYIDICLSGTILSIVMIVLFWLFREDNIWHQLGIGVFAFFIASLLISVIYLNYLTTEQTEPLQSVVPKLENGMVTPFRGDASTLYNYTISVRHNTNQSEIVAHVMIGEDIFFNYGTERNETMQLISSYNYTVSNSTVYIFNYSYTTHLTKLINSYAFNVSINGTWYIAGVPVNGDIRMGYGPVSSDSGTIFGNLVQVFTMLLFAYSFMPFLILVLFYRFSTKSRDARTKMLDEYKRLKMEKAGKGPEKPEAKEETFICSECGAEVQASAKFCPNCGESFDEDETPGINVGQIKEEKKD